jgi:glucose uptake protein GlcU
MIKGAIPTAAQFIILKFTTMEKAIKKAKLLGNTGMVLVIIGLTGLASISDWQNFYMLVVAVAAVMLVLSNAILTDIHKNIK